MNTDLVQLSAVGLALVPVVMALTQIVKMWLLDSRWAPLVSLGFGVLGAFVVPATTVPLTILQGVLIGLTAAGLFGGIKTLSTSTA